MIAAREKATCEVVLLAKGAEVFFAMVVPPVVGDAQAHP